MNSLIEVCEVPSLVRAYHSKTGFTVAFRQVCFAFPILPALFFVSSSYCPVFFLCTLTTSYSFSLVSRSLIFRLLRFWTYFLLWTLNISFTFYLYLSSLTLDLTHILSQHLCVLLLLLNYQMMPTTWLWFFITEYILVLNCSLASRLPPQLTPWIFNPSLDLYHIKISVYYSFSTYYQLRFYLPGPQVTAHL